MTNETDYEMFSIDDLLGVCDGLPYKKTPTSYKHEFIFDQDFKSKDQVSELVTVLREAESDDVVVLRINSNGGRVDVLTAVLDGIEKCRGMVVAYAEGNVYSAAFLMFCACDGYSVAEGASFLCHEGNMVDGGKPSDVKDYVDHHRKRMNILNDKYCKKFLTREELRKVNSGKELFLTSDDMNKRIQKYIDKMNKESDGE